MKTEEITICKMYLEDLDKHHDCNEYKLLMGLLEQEPCEDLCKFCDTKGCLFQSGIKRKKCDFYTHEKESCEDLHDIPSDEMTLGQARQAVKDLRKFVMDNHILPKLQPCEDVISRKAAQAKIKSICNKYGLSYEDGERKVSTGGSAYALGHALDEVPSATPSPRIGHWIKFKDFENGYYHIKCSECGQYWSVDGHAKIFKHCFNCGAKMEVE